MLLTFDDGPTSYLLDILSILKQENVQAIFFWQSNLIHDGESRWKDVLNQGHHIGTHAHSHPKLPEQTYEEQLYEIQFSKERLEALIGKTITQFRPPNGLYNEDTLTIAEKLGLDLILWQVASWDWMHEKSSEYIVKNVVDYTSAGDIVLLHELPQTVEVLRELIRTLKNKDFQFVKPHAPLRLINRGHQKENK